MTVTFVLDKSIKLPPLGLQDVKYDKQRFSGAIWKKNNLVFLIFENGKINCVGGKTIDQVNAGMVELLKCLNVKYYILDSKIVNLVASTTLSYKINLTLLYKNLSADGIKTSYEAELFAGLIARTHGVTFMCFHTGKVIVTGAKTPSQIEEAFEFLKDYLLSVRQSSIKAA